MTEPLDPSGDPPGPAGTQCALCGTDLSPSEYPNCRAVLIDETAAGGEKESVRMVCADCLAELEAELTDTSGPASGQSV